MSTAPLSTARRACRAHHWLSQLDQLDTSPVVPGGSRGPSFWKLHQGSLGRNAPLKTGILTESWEGFWNSAISGEQSLSFQQIFKGI